VLQLPIVKNKLKKLLSNAVKKMAIHGAPVIPSSDDTLDQVPSVHCIHNSTIIWARNAGRRSRH
jgi:hypothetical protein